MAKPETCPLRQCPYAISAAKGCKENLDSMAKAGKFEQGAQKTGKKFGE